jgi:hypothetical protein
MDKVVISIALCMIAAFLLLAPGGGCRAFSNSLIDKRCPETGAAVELPFKIAKINGWSECYLKCPKSWIPSDSFHGCPP